MRNPVEIHQDTNLVQVVHDLALEGYKGPGHPHYEPRQKYEWFGDLETRLWLDTGDAEAADKVWGPEIEALTTNNTLVNQVVQTGSMDGLISYAARKIREATPDMSEQDLIIEIAFLVNARLALSLVEKFGSHVSVELHPDTASNVESTLAFARRYYAINPSHFYIKVPLTPDGLVATRILAHENIPINLTLGFSARQNYLVARYAGPRYVNVFLGRLNSLVEENKLGNPANVGEKAALASYEAVKGLRESRIDVFTYQIAASMREGHQVVTLAGVDVLTIPPKAAAQYLEMDVKKHDVRRRSSSDLVVDLEPSAYSNMIQNLWEISPQFVAFVEDVAQRADQIRRGRDLIDISAEHHIDLFSEWPDDDIMAIREKGKIPDLSQWPGVPLDELMTISALQAFAKDQDELDQRIKKTISGL